MAVTRGPQLANAEADSSVDWRVSSRFALPQPMSDDVVAYIRDRTAHDARILSPSPMEMTIVTGRSNASAYAEFVQFVPRFGPEYLDAISFLEPSAVKRLRVSYIHASDDWESRLPDKARRWLHDPDLFELLIRDGADSLYLVRQTFLDMETMPPPESFEALRQAVQDSSTVYLSPSVEPANSIRAAIVLSRARLLGEARATPTWHSRPHVETEPLDLESPDLVVTSARLAPSSFSPAARDPIWWNNEIAVYAPTGTVSTYHGPTAAAICRASVECTTRQRASGI